MDRRSFIINSVSLVALGSLSLMGCTKQSERKDKKYTVNSKRCVGCGDCLRVCHEKAISIEGDFAVIDPSRCKGCGDCQKFCHKMAIVPFAV